MIFFLSSIEIPTNQNSSPSSKCYAVMIIIFYYYICFSQLHQRNGIGPPPFLLVILCASLGKNLLYLSSTWSFSSWLPRQELHQYLSFPPRHPIPLMRRQERGSVLQLPRLRTFRQRLPFRAQWELRFSGGEPTQKRPSVCPFRLESYPRSQSLHSCSPHFQTSLVCSFLSEFLSISSLATTPGISAASSRSDLPL